MKFLGIDLAWTQNNETGLIALERDGTVSHAGWTVGTAETLSWITARADKDTLIFVDAPLIVPCQPDVNQRPKPTATCEPESGFNQWGSG